MSEIGKGYQYHQSQRVLSRNAGVNVSIFITNVYYDFSLSLTSALCVRDRNEYILNVP